MSKKILDYLGIAKKGGMLITGEEGVIRALQTNKAKIVFVASDASLNTLDKFKRKCFYYNVLCLDIFTSAELSQAIGKLRKILAITDKGIAIALEKTLEVNK